MTWAARWWMVVSITHKNRISMNDNHIQFNLIYWDEGREWKGRKDTAHRGACIHIWAGLPLVALSKYLCTRFEAWCVLPEKEDFRIIKKSWSAREGCGYKINIVFRLPAFIWTADGWRRYELPALLSPPRSPHIFARNPFESHSRSTMILWKWCFTRAASPDPLVRLSLTLIHTPVSTYKALYVGRSDGYEAGVGIDILAWCIRARLRFMSWSSLIHFKKATNGFVRSIFSSLHSHTHTSRRRRKKGSDAWTSVGDLNLWFKWL